MPVVPIQRRAQTADVPAEQLAGNRSLTEREKIGQASREFEAMLLRQILENTQKPVIKSKLITDTTSTGIYRDLVTSTLAESISKSGEFGLAKTFEQQLSRQLASSPDFGGKTLAAKTGREPRLNRAPPAPARPPNWPFASSLERYEALHPKPAVSRGLSSGAAQTGGAATNPSAVSRGPLRRSVVSASPPAKPPAKRVNFGQPPVLRRSPQSHGAPLPLTAHD
jgi:Rod binding domain-containing protein